MLWASRLFFAERAQGSPEDLPAYLNYAVHAGKNSLYNTPPVFSIYALKLVLEHVKAGDGSPLLWVQRALNPVWKRAAVGCHLDRDTTAALRVAGFDTAPLDHYRDDTFFPPTAPRIRGVLRKGGAKG